MAALGQMGMLTAQTCPKGLVHEVEHILQVCCCLLEVDTCDRCESRRDVYHFSCHGNVAAVCVHMLPVEGADHKLFACMST